MLHETLAPLAEAVHSRIRDTLSPGRYEHSLRVARLSGDLCDRFSLDHASGYLAGLAHDLCKELPKEALMALAARDGREIGTIETKKPALLHGRAAAMVLVHEYGMKDGSIAGAVRHHTFGDPDLDPLSLVVYVADKLEPGRDQFPEEFRELVFGMELYPMTLAVLDHSIDYLESRGKLVSDESRRMRDALAKEVS